MTSLKEALATDPILTITVDPRSISKVLNQLNDALKRQARRIADLESNQNSFITRTEYSQDVSLIRRLSEASSKAIEQLLRESAVAKDEIARTREAFAKDIDEKFSAALLSANMTLKQSLGDIQSQIDSHSQQFDTLKADQSRHDAKHGAELAQLIEQIKRCNDRVSDHDSELLKHCSDCQKKSEGRSIPAIGQNSSGAVVTNDDFQALVNRVSKLEYNQQVIGEAEDTRGRPGGRVSDAELVNSRIQKLHNSMQEAITLPMVDEAGRPFDDKIDRIYAMTNQNRVSLLTALAQLAEHETQFDRLSQQIEQGLLRPVSVVSPEPPRLPRPLFEGAQREDIDSLAEKVGFLAQDLLKLKALVGQNEHNVREMVLAIIDEFKLIRGNAPGLDVLPPLNLSCCVPQFFHNPSFSFSRVDETDGETARSTDRPLPPPVSSECHCTFRIFLSVEESTTVRRCRGGARMRRPRLIAASSTNFASLRHRV
jgi:hypothetical protein